MFNRIRIRPLRKSGSGFDRQEIWTRPPKNDPDPTQYNLPNFPQTFREKGQIFEVYSYPTILEIGIRINTFQDRDPGRTKTVGPGPPHRLLLGKL